jgi:hypothetical protein
MSSRRKANKRRTRQPRQRSSRGRRSTQRMFDDGKSFRGQPKTVMRIISGPTLLSTTAGTGLIAYVQPIDVVNDIPSWASRFESLFQEFRLNSVTVTVTTIANTQGVGVGWFNEVNASPPTFPESAEQGRNRFPLSCNSSRSVHSYTWRPKTINDLIFTSTSTAFVPCSWKIFTNNSNYGSSLTAAQVILVEYSYVVEFRGYST